MKFMEKLKELWEYLKMKMLSWLRILTGQLIEVNLVHMLKAENRKGGDGEEVMLKMDCGAYYLPKKNLGEDAHFICAQGQTIGVADGVGGWAKMGVDAGDYSRELMKNSEKSVHSQHQAGEEIDPIKVLDEAYNNTKHVELGSSTACIVTLKNYKHGSVKGIAATLHGVNVGDSGFMVFRKDEKKRYVLEYQSKPQQRDFNFPFQLGNDEESDRPDSAREIKVGVLPEDVIVLATDGLFDNVFPHEIERVLNSHHDYFKTGKPEELANKIGEFASHKSRDVHCDTPFARVAMLEGGKIDDITLVVGVIVRNTKN